MISNIRVKGGGSTGLIMCHTSSAALIFRAVGATKIAGVFGRENVTIKSTKQGNRIILFDHQYPLLLHALHHFHFILLFRHRKHSTQTTSMFLTELTTCIFISPLFVHSFNFTKSLILNQTNNNENGRQQFPLLLGKSRIPSFSFFLISFPSFPSH